PAVAREEEVAVHELEVQAIGQAGRRVGERGVSDDLLPPQRVVASEHASDPPDHAEGPPSPRTAGRRSLLRRGARVNPGAAGRASRPSATRPHLPWSATTSSVRA